MSGMAVMSGHQPGTQARALAATAEPCFAASLLDHTFDLGLLQRVEDASLNASAPPQQLWMDGWLVRFNPGKAQRARCINAVAPGQGRGHSLGDSASDGDGDGGSDGGGDGGEGGSSGPPDDPALRSNAFSSKLKRCESLYRRHCLPLLFRITPFTQPPQLDAQLAALGYLPHEDTRVMVGPQALTKAQRAAAAHVLPEGLEWARLDAASFAQAIGHLRGSSAQACAAHAERLLASPVPYVSGVIRQRGAGQVLAAGQTAQEHELVGLYDVGVAASHRRQGLAQMLCERLLAQAAAAQPQGAQTAYLQVGADNPSAQRLYARMGFADAYSYHYRQLPQT